MSTTVAQGSPHDIAVYLPDAFVATGSLPPESMQSLVHGTRGRVFGIVAALVTDTRGKLILPRRRIGGEPFARSLDYPVSGTILALPDEGGRKRAEHPMRALLREAAKRGGAFADYVREILPMAQTVTFSPEPQEGLPFWEHVAFLPGVPEKCLPEFDADEYDPEATERVGFNDALRHVVADQRTHAGKPGLPRALRWATQDRVRILTAPTATL